MGGEQTVKRGTPVPGARGGTFSVVAVLTAMTATGIFLAGRPSSAPTLLPAAVGFEVDRSTLEAAARVAPPAQSVDAKPALAAAPVGAAPLVAAPLEDSVTPTPRVAEPTPSSATQSPRATETVRAPAVSSIPAPSSAPSVVVSRGRTDRRAVTLTFDAGADRGYAERILDVLAQQRVPAAFGITGQWAEANRDLVARAAREGHAFINHTYSHPSFTGVSWTVTAKTVLDRSGQLERTERILGEVAAASARPYFRPPFGDYDAGVLADVGRLGYGSTVMWTVDSMGWRGLDAASITRRCLDGAAPGAIYIFHVGEQSRDGDALPAVIEGLRARGFEIVPLAELLAPAS